MQERAKAGVEIRVIGKIGGGHKFDTKKLSNRRLHTRTIIRDRRQVFIGSQSLRAAELDSRRELGLIVHDSKLVKQIIDIFESDWKAGTSKSNHLFPKDVDVKQEKRGADMAESEKTDQEQKEQSERQAEVAVETFKHELDPLATTVKKAVRKAVAKAGEDVLKDQEVKDTMKKVVKKAVKEAVKEAVS
jgi:phosphatidylserine/phosphatidylglycerophosphate/cardiolipin synthase-like enzyme